MNELNELNGLNGLNETVEADIHMYGCFLLDVWAGINHYSAVHSSVALIAIYVELTRSTGSEDDRINIHRLQLLREVV